MQAQKQVIIKTQKGLSETYQLESPLTSEALRMYLRLQKLVGPAIGRLLSEDTGISDAVGGLAEALCKNEEGIEVAKALCGWANKKGQAVDFDIEFRGERMPLLVGFVKESLLFNFEDFFVEVSAAGKQVFTAMMKKMGVDLEQLEAEAKAKLIRKKK